MGTISWPPLNTNRSCVGAHPVPCGGSLYLGRPRSVWRAMNVTPTSQPTPAMPWPEPELYDNEREGCAPPRAGISEMGTLKLATPVDICVEKLSPMPWILPAPCGRLMAWLDTPVLSPPPSG